MYTPKTFSIPKLSGISETNIEEHMKLYQGYVKNTNHVLERISLLSKDSEANAYELGELHRRFSFEFDGMRNHEFYFAQLEGGAEGLDIDSKFGKKVSEDFGNVQNLLTKMQSICLTRGIGWAMLYFDKQSNKLLTAWVDEQHLGHLTGLSPIIAIDMWEHAYVADNKPSGKKQYISDFLSQINWTIIEKRFNDLSL